MEQGAWKLSTDDTFQYHKTCKTNDIKMLSKIVYACKYALSDDGCLV